MDINRLFPHKKGMGISMLFESNHSITADEFWLNQGMGMSFPIHIHRAFEFFTVASGCAHVTVDGTEYTVTENKAILVFPYQTHSYKSEADVKFFMLLFSPDIVPQFFKKTEKSVPLSNCFDFQVKEKTDFANIYLKKAFAYEICGEFEKQCTYRETAHSKKYGLLSDLLLYISDNYTAECSLNSAARKIGYDYDYLAKFFKRAVGIPFSLYVNMMKVSDAAYLLKTTDYAISVISEKCNFNCIRTFNRVFREKYGITPKEYRNREQNISAKSSASSSDYN